MTEPTWDRAVRLSTPEVRCHTCHGPMTVSTNIPYQALTWRCDPCQRVTAVYDIPRFLREYPHG